LQRGGAVTAHLRFLSRPPVDPEHTLVLLGGAGLSDRRHVFGAAQTARGCSRGLELPDVGELAHAYGLIPEAASDLADGTDVGQGL
jgi:hypothetical protein